MAISIHPGIRRIVNNLFKSILSNRTQKVNFNDHYNGNLEIFCGVLQNTVLGRTYS